MKNLKIVSLIAALIALFTLSITVSADTATGWSQNSDGGWSYTDQDGTTYEEGIYQIDGDSYLFENGVRLENNFGFYADPDTNVNKCYYAKKDGKLAHNEWLELSSDLNYWLYFGDDCAAVEGWQTINGKQYYFYNRLMYFSAVLEYDGKFYAFDKDGNSTEINRNGWSFFGGEWFYLDDGELAHGLNWINGNAYYFEYGVMCTDYTFWAHDEGVDYYYYATADGTLACNEWAIISDDWYYFTSNCTGAQGWQLINGSWYYFENGCMRYNTTVTDSDGRSWIFDEYGSYTELNQNGWSYAYGDWYYFENGSPAINIKQIGGHSYYFINGLMLTDYYFYLNNTIYYAKEDGTLACSEWIKEYNYYWYYFNSDCSMAQSDLLVIDNALYFFDGSGRMQMCQTICYDGRFMVADQNGVCTEGSNNSWILSGGDWYYVKDRSFACDEIVDINGVSYSFDTDCKLRNQKCVIYDDQKNANYLISDEGTVVTDTGWYAIYDSYVYVDDDGTLRNGFLSYEGQNYYMSPFMQYGNYFVDADTQTLCFANQNGITQPLTADGWHLTDFGFVYIRNGKVVTLDWILDGGYWYYAYPYAIVTTYTLEIDGNLYYFDQEGRMRNSGWILNDGGTWLYANPDGTLATGLSASGYLFNEYGKMLKNEPADFDINGKYYFADSNGIAHAVNYGWNNIDGNRCYLKDDDSFAYYGIYHIDGKPYYFVNYVMQTNCSYEDYYFGADGAVVSGWIYDEGYWYYADPNNNNHIYNYGILKINGVDYLFAPSLAVNSTLLYGNYLISTDANGVVVSKTAAGDGWYYENYNGYGYAVYKKDGKFYDGWYGDYYVKYGTMCVDDVVEVDNKYYYIDTNGLCTYNRWIEVKYEDWSDYYYAKADGSLAYDEWFLVNGTWYYFNSYNMVSSAAFYMESCDEWHAFAESGAWLGQVTFNSNGWQLINGCWYYTVGDNFATGMKYIDGEWYFFDTYGVMTTNKFCADVGTNKTYYYTENGTKANYTGWVFSNGKWCYFNSDTSVVWGWLTVNGVLYCQEWFQNYSTVGLLTSTYEEYNGTLYYFDENGVASAVSTQNGWLLTNSGWMYLVDSEPVCSTGYYEIDGAYYAFDYSGIMVCGGNYYDILYGEDGKAITANGWHFIDDEWFYIIGGYSAQGIHLIDGVQYYFNSQY